MCLDDDRPGDHRWRTKTPSGWRYWALAAHTPATTQPHVDCAGLCTWVHIPVGEKLWIIGSLPEPQSSVTEVMKVSLNKKGNIDERFLHWDCAHLQAGDEL